MFSFRAVRATKVIRSLALLVTIGAVLAPVVGPLVREGHSPELLGLGVGLLFAWPVFEFMSLYLLFIALVLRGMTRVFSFLFVSKITRVLSRALIPQLEVRRVEVIGGSPLRGVRTQPVTLHFVQDAWGFMERFDVHVFEPLRVKFEDGVEQSLELTHGALAIEPALQTPGSQVPTWLTVPKRDGVRFHRELPTGTRFVLTRGDAVVMLRFS